MFYNITVNFQLDYILPACDLLKYFIAFFPPYLLLGKTERLKSAAVKEMPFPRWDAAAAAQSLQQCPTLCDPINGSPPGSPVPGILQARTLEQVAISFSNA